MERISGQIQQLDLRQRCGLICCLLLSVLLCMTLSLVIHHNTLDKEKIVSPSLKRLPHEYVYVIKLNESWTPSKTYKYEDNETIPSV